MADMEFKEDNMIVGKHPVSEALKAGVPILKLFIQKGKDKFPAEILEIAGENEIPIQYVEKDFLGRITKGRAHQGFVAMTKPFNYFDLASILKRAKDSGEDPLIVILDHIEDPQNLGAIIRSAEGAGAHGLIIPNKRSARVTSLVTKASAGATAHLAIAMVGNLATTIMELKKENIWIAGCDMAEENYWGRDLKGPLAIVIGAEGKGLSRLIKDQCDFIISIPMKGKISSLNASSAAAIVLYEVRRQRDV